MVAVLSSLLLSLVPAAPAHAQTRDDYQRQSRTVTNDRRTDHDLTPLAKGRCVQKYARRQARKMANQDRMFHQALGPVLEDCDLSAVGENVAYGYPTGRAVVKAWMQSPGHRANILDPGYRLLGMAMRRSDSGTPYAAQVFGRR